MGPGVPLNVFKLSAVSGDAQGRGGVAAYLDEESKALGCELKVVRFVRF